MACKPLKQNLLIATDYKQPLKTPTKKLWPTNIVKLLKTPFKQLNCKSKLKKLISFSHQFNFGIEFVC